MENIEVEINFGIGNRIIRSFRRGTTIGQAINDATVKSALGHPQGVRALINRVPQNENTALTHGDVITLETVGAAKAA